MDLDPRRFWETVLDTIDVAVRILGHGMPSVEGREFMCALGPRDAGLCRELLDRVSRFFLSFRSSQTDLQGLTKRVLDRWLKNTFLLTMITLAGRHGRLPSSFTIVVINCREGPGERYGYGERSQHFASVCLIARRAWSGCTRPSHT